MRRHLGHCSDVKDIHDVLDVSVFDEDKDHRSEFLGRVKIPLVRVRNDERRWYALKDRKLRKPAKGDNPAVLLEMFFVYNKVRRKVLHVIYCSDAQLIAFSRLAIKRLGKGEKIID
jgi:hypothetical protein